MEPTAFDYLWVQISKPDNVPAILLLVLTAFYCWLTWKKAKINDARETPVESEMTDKVQVWTLVGSTEADLAAGAANDAATAAVIQEALRLCASEGIDGAIRHMEQHRLDRKTILRVLCSPKFHR